jgi:hypothetical protein
VTTPISTELTDILDKAADGARYYEPYPAVHALIVAAMAAVKASQGLPVPEPEPVESEPLSGPLPE